MRGQSSSAKGAGGSSSRSRATPCCSKVGLKRGPWTPEEDKLLTDFINKEGEGRWRTLPKKAGLLRCGKSCRLRWMNYLRPTVKRGHITPDEEDLILRLHRLLGNRWSLIAGRIPGRTDNEIKNYWNTHLTKKLINQGIDPRTHKPLGNPNNDNKNHTLAPIKPKAAIPVIHPTNEDSTVKISSCSVILGGTYQIEEQLDHQNNSVGGTNQIEELLHHQDSNGGGANQIEEQLYHQDNNGGGENQIEEQLYHQENNGGGTDQTEEQLHHQNNSGSAGNGDHLNMVDAGGIISIEDDDEDIGMDFCPDDVFSSFFDSLMNDDTFFAAAQKTQQSNDTVVPSTSEYNQPSNSFQQMNFPFSTAGWDDDFLP